MAHQFPERVAPSWGNWRLLVYRGEELTDDEFFYTLELVRNTIKVDLPSCFMALVKNPPVKIGAYNYAEHGDMTVYFINSLPSK